MDFEKSPEFDSLPTTIILVKYIQNIFKNPFRMHLNYIPLSGKHTKGRGLAFI